MFSKDFDFLSRKLTNCQKIFFFFLKKTLKVIDIPLFPQFPLLNFSLNFKLIVEMAMNYEVPQKFIDFSLDASELYYSEFNSDSEFLYYSIILSKVGINYKFIFLLCNLKLFFKFWKTIFLFWCYAISLPFIFLAIFLYIDYLDGYFD